MISFVIKTAISVLIIVLIAGVARTWQLEHSDLQKMFISGTVPSPALDGLYAGGVPGHASTGSWLGKKFDSVHSTGDNVFAVASTHLTATTTEAFPFASTVGTGIRDNISVLKIDYASAANPWWLRPILDEVVQTSPGEYLGKMQARIIPGYAFTFLFFTLKK